MATLFLVPTPIGNLDDITHRAIKVLGEADLILAEDTRTSGKLLQHLGISTPMQAYHMHNEHKITDKLVYRMKEGENMALISDAGTPGISDPGFLLTRACIEAGISVQSLPGPTALIPALVNSGLPSDRFTFEGFLPLKKGRQTRLKELSEESRTMIFYESPHKLLKTLENLIEFLGPDRPASISRELTKLYEETVRGSLSELLMYYNQNPLKGEFVIVVGGKK
ncbi:16S rRNA (cytidine1402-2'-O)-methyltransferase [Muriicola jejuensis]|uniref:Ribosomal RNA small subunit methyltransferase I n=1 Tax=Muriicola jejuensis TaxID=504488 RepID=A0A6P0UAM1_9FLAO|nr:16S rRNA (cytidine(1402)-2'-O)-methyltransferase [Muriicola jejuensis]NER10087.1 16S rRNA (cytidine(1402)-2'-O)-methyltransferase [Muriicola jejuensis]SMP03078.1 16S rRNA (cytidine1402-2'-O)-methyltransferase [Muriicola jejuensis]